MIIPYCDATGVKHGNFYTMYVKMGDDNFVQMSIYAIQFVCVPSCKYINIGKLTVLVLIIQVWAKSSDVDFYPHFDANHSAKHQSKENAIVAYDPNNTPETPVDLDESDMTPSIQEALHRSNMDIRYYS